jgi:hypothetical protein
MLSSNIAGGAPAFRAGIVKVAVVLLRADIWLLDLE